MIYLVESITDMINPFPNKPWFSRVCSTSLLKTLGNGEMLVTSNFSFSHSVFYSFGELSAIFIKNKIVVCRVFQFGKVYNLLFGKGLNPLLSELGSDISNITRLQDNICLCQSGFVLFHKRALSLTLPNDLWHAILCLNLEPTNYPSYPNQLSPLTLKTSNPCFNNSEIETYENILEKGENAQEHHLFHFPMLFSTKRQIQLHKLHLPLASTFNTQWKFKTLSFEKAMPFVVYHRQHFFFFYLLLVSFTNSFSDSLKHHGLYSPTLLKNILCLFLQDVVNLNVTTSDIGFTVQKFRYIQMQM